MESVPCGIDLGTGAEQDLFEPAHEGPKVGAVELMRLGMYKKDYLPLGEPESVEHRVGEEELQRDMCIVI